jgi:hypothetical protein
MAAVEASRDGQAARHGGRKVVRGQVEHSSSMAGNRASLLTAAVC